MWLILSRDGFSDLALSHTDIGGLAEGDHKLLMVLFGTMAVIGHLIPVFAKFKGVRVLPHCLGC